MDIITTPERTPQLITSLHALWEQSVRATHLFLSEEDIETISPMVPLALREVPILVAAYDRNSEPSAFMGIDGHRLEMLFIRPGQRGQGLGRQLLTMAVEQYQVNQLCVNEQNPQARGFYEHMGFQVYKRTEQDEQGGPFPLLYMKKGDSLSYRQADLSDLDILTQVRVRVLRAANRLDDSVDMSLVEQESRRYYETSLGNGSHAAYLVYDGDQVVGAGGVSFYQVMPTYHTPSGMKAYIMNMYTDPQYRRRGIASHTLELLVQECRERGVDFIALEATDMGRPLYEKYGFVKMEDEMQLREEKPYD